MLLVVAIIVGSLLVLSGASGLTRGLVTASAAAANGSWTQCHRDDGHTGYDPTQPQLTGTSA